MDDAGEPLGATRGVGGTATDGDAASRLEDAVRRSMSDFESEHEVRKSQRPGVHGEHTPECFDTMAGER